MDVNDAVFLLTAEQRRTIVSMGTQWRLFATEEEAREFPPGMWMVRTKDEGTRMRSFRLSEFGCAVQRALLSPGGTASAGDIEYRSWL